MPANVEYYFEHVKIYDKVLHRELNTRSGELWGWFHKKGELAVIKAKAQAGYKTGQLRRSIRMQHTGSHVGQELKIGSTVKHAYMHHEGTRPHKIVPKDIDGRLVFFGKNQRKIIAVREVNHPGTKPNRYLSDQLRVFRT